MKFRTYILIFCGVMILCGCTEPTPPPTSIHDQALAVGVLRYNNHGNHVGVDESVENLLPPSAKNIQYLGNGYYEFQFQPPHGQNDYYLAVVAKGAYSDCVSVSITKE